MFGEPSASDTSKSPDNQTSIASPITSAQSNNSLSGAWLMLPAGAVAILAVLRFILAARKKASSSGFAKDSLVKD
jgi:hypothetical protein